MRLLVVGADRVDAGKTTFSVGLLARIGGVGFKPRAGNDHWFDHDDYLHAVDRERLYGRDAKRLAAASAADVVPEEINPIHRLWRPSPGPGTGILGQDDRVFVVDRVGGRPDLDGDGRAVDPREAGSYVVNDAAPVPPEARESLPLSDAVRVDSLSAFNEVMGTRHLAALSAVGERIDRTERAVVESYGDVARPLRSLNPDAVAVVEPTRTRVYTGDRYMRSCEVASGGPGDGRLEERVEAVTDLLDPEAAVALPALSDDERGDPDAVTAAYAPAYDALVSTARERSGGGR